MKNTGTTNYMDKLTKFSTNKILVILMIIGFILRLIHLNDKLPGLDEGYSVQTMTSTFQGLIESILYSDISAPLYPLISNIIYHLTGSFFIVRLFSVIAGVLLIYVSFLVAKELFNEKTAIITALFITFNPMLFFLSQHMRMYILFTLLSTSLILFTIRYLKKPDNNFYPMIILSALVMYSHYHGIIVVGTIFSYIFIKNLKNKEILIKSAIAFIGSFLLFIPWFLYFIFNTTIFGKFHVSSRSVLDFLYVFYKFSMGANIGTLLNGFYFLFLALPIILIFFVKGFLEILKENKEANFLNYFFWLPLITVFIFTLFLYPQVFSFHYFIFLLPIFLIFVAHGISNTKYSAQVSFLITVFWLMIIALYFYFVTITDWQVLFGL